MSDADKNSDQNIQLDQFLKLHGLVQSGGEAKHLIKSGQVTVNGELELRRGRKLKPGDRVIVQEPHQGQEQHLIVDSIEP